MPDLTSSFLSRLEAARLPGLDLGPGALYPSYNGLSIANLPSSICRWLGVETLPGSLPPLVPELLDGWGRPFRQVILLVLDGFGFTALQQAVDDGGTDAEFSVWRELAAEGLLAPLSSIVPSTTSAALTTFWTGVSPAEHGVIGYELFLREYGLTANMIRHTPASYAGGAGSLVQAGFRPETFLPVPTLGPHLVSQGVQVTAGQHRSILISGLSTMLLAGAEPVPLWTVGDLFVTLQQRLEADPNQRSYTYLYWSSLDELMHRFGPADERVRRELAGFSQQLAYFIAECRAHPRGDTLLVITADHGHLSTPRQAGYELRRHPELLNSLVMMPAGEARLPLVFVRSGREQSFLDYVAAAWPGQFRVVPSAQFIQAGMFGPRGVHPSTVERGGDYVVIPQGDAYWYFGNNDNPLLGRHGGISRTEMLSPLLAVAI